MVPGRGSLLGVVNLGHGGVALLLGGHLVLIIWETEGIEEDGGLICGVLCWRLLCLGGGSWELASEMKTFRKKMRIIYSTGKKSTVYVSWDRVFSHCDYSISVATRQAWSLLLSKILKEIGVNCPLETPASVSHIRSSQNVCDLEDFTGSGWWFSSFQCSLPLPYPASRCGIWAQWIDWKVTECLTHEGDVTLNM